MDRPSPGASFADHLGFPHSVGGADLGHSVRAAVVAVPIVVLLAYLAYLAYVAASRIDVDVATDVGGGVGGER